VGLQVLDERQIEGAGILVKATPQDEQKTGVVTRPLQSPETQSLQRSGQKHAFLASRRGGGCRHGGRLDLPPRGTGAACAKTANKAPADTLYRMDRRRLGGRSFEGRSQSCRIAGRSEDALHSAPLGYHDLHWSESHEPLCLTTQGRESSLQIGASS
jgi:hypothetical protein